MVEYTTVVGTDKRHIDQLAVVYLTWKLNKPDLLNHPLIVFVDRDDRKDITDEMVQRAVCNHPDLRVVTWPPENVTYQDEVLDKKNKFGKAQRYKMMAGFVHVPAQYVETEYWLKLDSDAVATGHPNWIDEDWFENGNADIVGHRWGFTKPANFPAILDEWYCKHVSDSPLNLPLDSPDSERISHPRISSWCCFFDTTFTRLSSLVAEDTCGEGKLPVPSQDTYLWYMAEQGSGLITRVNMKQHGWTYKSNVTGVLKLVHEVLGVN